MRSSFHRHLNLVTCILALLSGFFVTASAQNITVNEGNVSLSIATGMAGGQLLSVVSTTTTISYKKQNDVAKITVKTVCLGQKYSLEVLATNVSAGVAAPPVVLLNGSPAVDLIRDIQKTGSKNATGVLQYTASATFAQGNSTEFGSDIHTITYTIQLQ